MENQTYEQLITKLQQIVESLESGNLSLEDSVKLYQEGMELSLECQKRLEQAKAVIVKKIEDNKETIL